MAPLDVESWIWYSMVMLVAGSRYISRRMVLGSFRKFQADDYIMAVVLCFYTTVIVTINIVRHTSSNLLPPGFDVNTLTHHEIEQRQYGSKLILVVEQSQCATIWGAKLSLVILYLRLTPMRRVHRLIKALAVYIVGSFIVMDILYFAVWCRPFREYWQVPTNSRQCDAATNHLITNASFNISSDLVMLAIGLPMFIRLNLPWQKKIPLIVVFSLGIFVILAAILNKVYSFTDPFGAEWTYWYVRESSTALLVANLPFVWTLWSRLFGIRKLTGVGATEASHLSGDFLEDGSKLERLNIESTKKRARSVPAWPSTYQQEYNDTSAIASSSASATAVSEGGAQELSLVDALADLSSYVYPTSTTLNTAGSGGTSSLAEPNPVTHPMLFYTRRSKALESELPWPQAVYSSHSHRFRTMSDASTYKELTPQMSSSSFDKAESRHA